MKLVMLTHRYPPDGVAGVERASEGLARSLTTRGHEVTVVGRREVRMPRHSVDCEVRDGIRVFTLTGRLAPLTRPTRRQGPLTPSLDRILLEEAPDIVHLAHPFGFGTSFAGAVIRHRVPLVVSLHDFFFVCPLAHLEKLDGRRCEGPDGGLECASTCFSAQRSAVPRWVARATFFQRCLALANAVVAPSHYVADYFQSRGYVADPIDVIPNAIAVPEASMGSRQRNASGLRLAYIGVVTAHKGVHTLFEAAASAEEAVASILVAGAQPDRRYVRRLRSIARRAPSVDVDFRGAYELSDLPALLDGVDAVVVPSRVPESFSLTAREAMVLGIPVVVARIGALPEAIVEGVTGWSFVPDSASSLAETLRVIASDPDRLERAGIAAGETEVLAADEHARRIEAVYERVISDGRVVSEAARTELAALDAALVTLGS
jgi:glycosyltransferase involved in cell wall biosynthesis